MTHITIKKAKLEQWLEAFEICVDCRPIGTETMTQTRESKVLHGLKTIKAALAQTAQEPDNGDELTIAYMSGVHRGKELAAQPAPVQEPVAFLANGTRFKISYDSRQSGGQIHGIPPELGGRWVAFVAAEDDCHLKLTTPPAAQPAQEPVAWMQVTKYGNKLLAFTEPPLEPPCYTEEFIAAKNYPLFLKKENT
jgi:hypothetical protein